MRNVKHIGKGNGIVAVSRTFDRGWALEFEDPDGSHRLVVEDDGSVCYAYLLDGDAIVGDVWLYNVGDSPKEVDWSDRSLMPFQNPARYCRIEESHSFDRSRMRCAWNGGVAHVFIGDLLWAKVGKGDKPGRSILAAAPSPVACPLKP